ncbi:50S ribosomal protein L13 [Rickettsiales endosymbiont of Stachyamoeba lipophora]|uniref:50S ribosomal protein L13 n=1 Tax=Rickettsiales endosymbiont of Stachyamoeba lipophora TaxID=2486578 RepID=UPI000F648E68|nr:50S ribosomal protein L13 [Rickettsiales endosymbiont of Stachyamoeba lipophora]AZL15973.1 50S ribosomal protein L13 [Rickettsiales endosymbiont of Stachyamoeba lipophora]
MFFKTYSMKQSEVQKNWLVIDAEGLVVGRLASLIAKYLRGKHKASYTAHMDCGDYVIVVNADKVALTGNKGDRKDGAAHYWHTGYPGGIKKTTAGKILEGKFPTRVLMNAVKRMLPKDSPLARKQLTHLFLYSGSEHPHQAQTPQVVDVAKFNSKNTKKKAE